MVFGLQLFVAGLALVLGAAAARHRRGWALWQAYVWLPHFTERVNDFLDPDLARLPGRARAARRRRPAACSAAARARGVQKWHLPDAHTDFIFAATAEEFGMVACLALVALFAFLHPARPVARSTRASDRFVQLAATGLVAQFGLQALINMAVNLNLIPTKGMTLPFISYGGSSLLALAIGMGMLLALTRRGARLAAADACGTRP